MTPVTLGTNGVLLGQNRITFGLQRYERGILLGNDFRHLPQMMQRNRRLSGTLRVG